MTADLLLSAIREDLILGDENLELMEFDGPGTGHASAIAAAGEDRPLLLVFPGNVSDAALATLRDAVWPRVHFMSLYRVDAGGAIRRTFSGRTEALPEPSGGPLTGGARTAVYTRTREDALGPANTRIKFDLRASSWNGEPGSPTYGHFRWMRRLVAQVARPRRGERTLDAGCGAGWVGIEAALMGASVSAFDASPAMVDIARQNAVDVGVDLDARPGFVEEVPFDHDFELVLNSGVISFAPDADVYLDRLDALVAPGGRLCIGDINPLSRGFRRRRQRHPLLPARELNGLTRARIAAMLERRGYTIESRYFYQLTFPVPELMAVSEQRWKGLGCGLLLGANRAATSLDHALGSKGRGSFDSWIVRARKGGAAGESVPVQATRSVRGTAGRPAAATGAGT